MTSGTEATIDDLYAIQGKAELVGGAIVITSHTGDMPSSAAGEVLNSLHQYAKQHGGHAFTDNAAFLVDRPHRKSFCPDAAYYTGQRAQMKFLPEAPDFAVAVRCESDYGPAADRAAAAKRANYFTAGTKMIWDVDLLGEDVVRVYRASTPEQPPSYRHGQPAEVEPAVLGWTFSIDESFQ